MLSVSKQTEMKKRKEGRLKSWFNAKEGSSEIFSKNRRSRVKLMKVCVTSSKDLRFLVFGASVLLRQGNVAIYEV